MKAALLLCFAISLFAEPVVIRVTNLNDSGPGSLRGACEASGPRKVEFAVGGIIDLQSPIVISSPEIEIDGSTAPGDGVCLRRFGIDTRTHEVTLRHLRVRPGDVSGKEVDGINIGHGSQRILVDHCSVTWAVDEQLSLAGDVADVTVQWCLIGEALNRSVHKKGAHGYGSLARASGPVTFHHNLWAHNTARNPRLGDNYGKPPFPSFDVRNNVIYDFGGTATGLTQGTLKVNLVNNYYRRGPSSRARTAITMGVPSDMDFYIRGNVVEDDAEATSDNTRMFDRLEADGKRLVRFASAPVAPTGEAQPAAEAFEAVLEGVGATLPVRDAVDRRIVEEVRTRGGRIIDSQNDVGGWPEYRGQ
jgi:hypothetical protein